MKSPALACVDEATDTVPPCGHIRTLDVEQEGML